METKSNPRRPGFSHSILLAGAAIAGAMRDVKQQAIEVINVTSTPNSDALMPTRQWTPNGIPSGFRHSGYAAERRRARKRRNINKRMAHV